jgi:hypothetical protein
MFRMARISVQGVEGPDGPVEVDEQVDLAIRRGVAPGHQAEDVERANAEARQLGALLGQSALDLFARHGRIIDRADKQRHLVPC